MPVIEFFAGIPVADFTSARQWYERLWGRPPDFSPQEGEAVWQITDHAWVYVVADTERAGRGLLTLLIDDLEQRIVDLAHRGIDSGPVESIGDSVLGVRIHDRDGNRITFGRVIAGASA